VEVRQDANQVVIEGRTDSRPFRKAAPSGGHSNRELSTDRANAARRLLLTAALAPRRWSKRQAGKRATGGYRWW
jgi:flagellar motor protein MotB